MTPPPPVLLQFFYFIFTLIRLLPRPSLSAAPPPAVYARTELCCVPCGCFMTTVLDPNNTAVCNSLHKHKPERRVQHFTAIASVSSGGEMRSVYCASIHFTPDIRTGLQRMCNNRHFGPIQETKPKGALKPMIFVTATRCTASHLNAVGLPSYCLLLCLSSIIMHTSPCPCYIANPSIVITSTLLYVSM
jgi:hypothetical protein